MALLFCGIGPQAVRFCIKTVGLKFGHPRPPPRPRSLEVAVNFPNYFFSLSDPLPSSPGSLRDALEMALRFAKPPKRSEKPLGGAPGSPRDLKNLRFSFSF